MTLIFTTTSTQKKTLTPLILCRKKKEKKIKRSIKMYVFPANCYEQCDTTKQYSWKTLTTRKNKKKKKTITKNLIKNLIFNTKTCTIVKTYASQTSHEKVFINRKCPLKFHWTETMQSKTSGIFNPSTISTNTRAIKCVCMKAIPVNSSVKMYPQFSQIMHNYF